VCACRQGKIDCQEARGFALADPYAPFIYVNSADALAGQLFTLVHELAHIWLGESGISNLEGIPAGPPIGPPGLETFCNSVASLALVAPDDFRAAWTSTDRALDLGERIGTVSSSLKVSEEFVARRLLDEREIARAQYARLRRHYEARWQALAARSRRGGGGNYYYSKVASNSRAFTQTVIGACRGGQITVRDASSLLGIKANHLSTLAAHAGYPLRRRGR
jgi:Zn-dependent peptidase ImmA (M78 family)